MVLAMNDKYHFMALCLKKSSRRHNIFHINDSGQTTASAFYQTEPEFYFNQEHTWGFPVYVLDRKLQYGHSRPPKWDTRTRLGIYVGHSPVHAGDAALMLKPTTGYCYPQFYVVFDDEFCITFGPKVCLDPKLNQWAPRGATKSISRSSLLHPTHTHMV